MKIEQAIYGEGRDGHGLREASHRSRLFYELESHLDLPDTAPPGVEWSPFLRGFPFGEYYILARTFADPAGTRTGLVLTHAIVGSLPEVAHLNDLRPLLALLIQTPQLPVVIESKDVSISATAPPNASDLVSTADALTTRGSGPVVRIGTEGFDELVCALWFRLWPELRKSFAFRLSFGPSDVVGTSVPSLVCSPQSLSARWTGYRVVGHSAPTRSSAAALLSGVAAAEPILTFAREIGARLDELGNLPLIERAYVLWQAPNPLLADCVSMLRLIEGLSPNATAGELIKNALVKRAQARLVTASAEEVHLLRNLRTTGFPTANALWESLYLWVAQNEYAPSDDVELLAICRDAISPSAAVTDWREAILRGIKSAAQSSLSLFPQAFWRWADSRSSTLAELAFHLPKVHDLEARLAEAAPQEVAREVGAEVMAIAVSKRWWQLHGVAAGASLTPKEALLSQLAIDPAAATRAAMKAALRRATPQQVLVLTLELADPRVIDLAAEVVAIQPHLLQDVDLTSMSAQEVWARALCLNPQAWSGPQDPARVFASILQALANIQPVNEELIAALATTPLADLSSCACRTKVWSRVSDTSRKLLLRATAKGWLERALANHAIQDLEAPLENALLTEIALDQELRAAAASKPGTVIRVISAIPRFEESRFLPCLDLMFASRSILTAIDIDTLGNLVLSRRWQRAVDKLVQLARSGRHEVTPALQTCVEMIGFLAKWLLGLSSTSPDTPWLIIEELAVDLYSTGPDHDELWSRAGGNAADLQKNGSGRNRWRDALAMVRHGKAPGIDGLLSEMSRDFPNNEHLRRLKSTNAFYSGHKFG